MASDSTFRFACSECTYKARMPKKYLGLAIKCPKCDAKVRAEDSDSVSTGNTAAITKVERSEIQPADNKFRFECRTCNYRARMPVKYMGMAIKCPKCGDAQMASPHDGEGHSGQTVAVGKVEKAIADKFLFQCEECGYRARLPTKYEDQHIQCPGCKATILAVRAPDGPPTGDTVTVTRVEPSNGASPMGEAHQSGVQETLATTARHQNIIHIEESEEEATEPSISGLDQPRKKEAIAAAPPFNPSIDYDQLDLGSTPSATPTANDNVDPNRHDQTLATAAPSGFHALLKEDTDSADMDVDIPENFATSSDTLKKQSTGNEATLQASDPSRTSTQEMLEELRSANNQKSVPPRAPKKRSSRQVQISHESEPLATMAAPASTSGKGQLLMTIGLSLLFLTSLIFGGMWFITQKNLEEANQIIARRNQTINNLEAQLTQTQANLTATQNSLTTAESTLKTTAETLSNTKASLSKTQATLSDTEATLATRVEELTISQSAVSRLENTEKILEADLASKIDQINTLNMEMNQAAAARRELESQIEDLKRLSGNINGLSNARSSADVMTKTFENNQLREQVGIVEAELANIKRRLEGALNRAQRAETEVADLKAQLGSARAKIIELEGLIPINR